MDLTDTLKLIRTVQMALQSRELWTQILMGMTGLRTPMAAILSVGITVHLNRGILRLPIGVKKNQKKRNNDWSKLMKEKEIQSNADGTVINLNFHDSNITHLCVKENNIEISFQKELTKYVCKFRNCVQFNILNYNPDFIVSDFLSFSIGSVPIENDSSIGLFSLYCSRSKLSDLSIMKNRLLQLYRDFRFFNIVSVTGESIAIVCQEATEVTELR
jgi:hypothetical protein